jgi:hypothetical protein
VYNSWLSDSKSLIIPRKNRCDYYRFELCSLRLRVRRHNMSGRGSGECFGVTAITATPAEPVGRMGCKFRLRNVLHAAASTEAPQTESFAFDFRRKFGRLPLLSAKLPPPARQRFQLIGMFFLGPRSIRSDRGEGSVFGRVTEGGREFRKTCKMCFDRAGKHSMLLIRS